MTRRGRRFVFAVALVALLGAAVEGSSYGLLWLSRSFVAQEIRRTADVYREQSEGIRSLLALPEEARDVFDAELGWRYRPGYRDDSDAINAQGLRSFREYAARPPLGVVRVAAFGDSFVYCNEVGNADAWPTLLEGDGRAFEVLNYGVGGYGTDQALIRYRAEGQGLSPEVVLIGFAPINVRRNVNVYRRFLHNRGSVATKPRFVLDEDGGLVLIPNPIRRPDDWIPFLDEPSRTVELGENDHWYRASIYQNPLYDWLASVRLATNAWIRLHDRYLRRDRVYRGDSFHEASSAFALQLTLLRRFAAEVEAPGATPFVLVLISRESLRSHLAGGARSFDSLVQHLDREGQAWLDTSDAFAAQDAARLRGELLRRLRPSRGAG